MEKRVTGLGGIFFKSENPAQVSEWYKKHLGLDVQSWGGATFNWKETDGRAAYSVWSPFKKDTTYFEPGRKEFMINYRVENLEELLEALKSEGVQVVGEMQASEYGKFGWIMDPEGNKIELWEAVDNPDEK